MAHSNARRKVFFYRALDSANNPVSGANVCTQIRQLKDPYFDDDGQVTRAAVFTDERPQCIRFFRVRRDQLPPKDNGRGGHEDLSLRPGEGLAEAIHLCWFPDGVVGAEFFFYGPRVNRFGAYIREKLELDVQIRPLVRHDAVERALRFHDIRLVRIKIDPSDDSKTVASPGLKKMLSTAQDFDAGVWAEFALRAEKGDEKFKSRVKALIRSLFSSREGAIGEMEHPAVEKLEIEGKAEPDSSVESLDLLSEKLYRQIEVPYSAPRSRELDADQAFAAIKKAYSTVRDSLPRDGLG